MKIRIGDFESYGTKETADGMMFTFFVREDQPCAICLYDRRSKKLIQTIDLSGAYRIGQVYSVEILGRHWERCCYRIRCGEHFFVDAYARSIVGREKWKDASRIGADDGLYGGFVSGGQEIAAPRHFIEAGDMVMYKLHMRGFTMQHGYKASEKGNDAGLIAGLPYLQRLGVTSIEFQPIYEFEEVFCEKKTLLDEKGISHTRWQTLDKTNYWGYGNAYYFAPKASYFGGRHAVERCRVMIQKIHEAGMEVILEMAFASEVPQDMMLDCLWYWVRYYGADGFHLLGCNIPIKRIAGSYRFRHTKIFCENLPEEILQEQKGKKHIFLYKDDFQYVGRQLQNHMQGSMVQFTNYLRRQNVSYGFVNYMANTTGFTLLDSYSYGEKHNRDNGEENRDGNNFNCSFNYGAEGATKNKQIQKMRFQQVKNGLCMTFLSQAVPLLVGGDECLNSQEGNNNPYCQDNRIGWVQYQNRSSDAKALGIFVKNLIAFRKEHRVLRQENAMCFNDYKHLGMPDLSYHGAEPWLMQVGDEQKAIGILYAGAYAGEAEDVYVAYNFHYERARIALPRLSQEKRWMQVMNTADHIGQTFEPVALEEQGHVEVAPQSISILISCAEQGKEYNESVRAL